MKIKIRPDDPDMLQEPDWRQMNGWLAEIRDDGHARPASDDHARRAPGGDPRPEAVAEPEAAAESESAAELAPAEAPACDATTVRAVIGDELRMPIMWCEMGSCISWRTDPSALGEADARARAISAGWRIDALGRLACPQCQQTDPGFWATSRVVRWDRYTAVASVRGVGLSLVGLAATAAFEGRNLAAAHPVEKTLDVVGEVRHGIQAAHARRSLDRVERAEQPVDGFLVRAVVQNERALFDLGGHLIARLQDGPWFNAPWGVALAPGDFGKFTHRLLIGNFGDGTIHGFNAFTRVHEGAMINDTTGQTLSIDGLWALSFGGDSTTNGTATTLFFSSGPNDENDGVFGQLTAVSSEQPGNTQ